MLLSSTAISIAVLICHPYHPTSPLLPVSALFIFPHLYYCCIFVTVSLPCLFCHCLCYPTPLPLPLILFHVSIAAFFTILYLIFHCHFPVSPLPPLFSAFIILCICRWRPCCPSYMTLLAFS